MVSSTIIACEVLRDELTQLAASVPDLELSYVPMALRMSPHKLREELQMRIAATYTYERIILGFGLCGTATGESQQAACVAAARDVALAALKFETTDGQWIGWCGWSEVPSHSNTS